MFHLYNTDRSDKLKLRRQYIEVKIYSFLGFYLYFFSVLTKKQLRYIIRVWNGFHFKEGGKRWIFTVEITEKRSCLSGRQEKKMERFH